MQRTENESLILPFLPGWSLRLNWKKILAFLLVLYTSQKIYKNLIYFSYFLQIVKNVDTFCLQIITGIIFIFVLLFHFSSYVRQKCVKDILKSVKA